MMADVGAAAVRAGATANAGVVGAGAGPGAGAWVGAGHIMSRNDGGVGGAAGAAPAAPLCGAYGWNDASSHPHSAVNAQHHNMLTSSKQNSSIITSDGTFNGSTVPPSNSKFAVLFSKTMISVQNTGAKKRDHGCEQMISGQLRDQQQQQQQQGQQQNTAARKKVKRVLAVVPNCSATTHQQKAVAVNTPSAAAYQTQQLAASFLQRTVEITGVMPELEKDYLTQIFEMYGTIPAALG